MMLAVRRPGFVLVLLAAACHSGVAVDPLPGEARALLFVVGSEGGDLEAVVARDLEASEGPPALGLSGEKTVHAVQLACPLDVMDLRPGLQTLQEEEDGSTTLALPVLGIHRAELAPSKTALPWQGQPRRVPVVSEAISRLDVAETTWCERGAAGVVVEQYAVELGEGVNSADAAIVLGPGRVLLSLNDGSFALLRPSGDVQRVELTTRGATSAPSKAGFRGEDGQIWLVDERGRLMRGTLVAGFEQIVDGGLRLSGPLRLTQQDGVIFVVSRAIIARLEGTSWRAVFDVLGEAEIARTIVQPNLLALEPRQWVGVVQHRPPLLVGDERAEASEFPEVPETFEGNVEVASTVVRSSLMGVLAGSLLFNPTRFAINGGYLHVHDSPNGWTRLDETYLAASILFSIELGGDLILYGGPVGSSGNSIIGVYHPFAGSCQQVPVAGFIRQLVPVSDDRALVLQSPSVTNRDAFRFSVLTRPRTAHECLR